MKTALNRILTLTLILFGVTLLFSLIGFNLGYEGFILVGEININPIVDYVLCWILLGINVFIWASISWSLYRPKQVLKLLWPYFILDFIVQIIWRGNALVNGLLPAVYIMWIAYAKGYNLKSVVLRLIKTLTWIAVFQLIWSVVRIGSFNAYQNQSNTTFYQTLVISVDMLILMLILYFKGGEKHYAQRLEHFMVEQKSVVPIRDEAAAPEEVEFLKLVGFKRAKAMSLLLGIQIIEWVLILFVCSLGNRLVEALVITTSFVAYGTIVQKRWHHPTSLIACALISSLMFYVSARAIPAFGYSQLFPVLTGLVLVYLLYKIAVYTEGYNGMKEYIENLKSFKLEKYCDRETMIELAKEKGLTSREIELLDYKYCKASTWNKMEAKFHPWSLSSIKKYLKEAETKFYG